MIQVALAVMSMEWTANWAKGRGPIRPIFPTPQAKAYITHAKMY